MGRAVLINYINERFCQLVRFSQRISSNNYISFYGKIYKLLIIVAQLL